ncbi:PF06074 family protein [Burkholderia aenigmatica]|uniref:PF06074 family protein n=2 Tax=Burkholderia aenigmatica TaxID=2015348 RepID=A0A6P2SPR6_9BURK|nr:PF06074 family protein [Burkholderia aenigmatica]
MRAKGMWVSPTEFVQFGEPSKSLSDQIATRGRSIDFYGLGMYLPNPDPVLKALGKDIKVYRELRADAHVGGCIRRRKAAVKALEWGLDRDKAKSRVAKSIEAIFADLDLSRIITEMLDAVLYGYQPMEVMWGKVGGYLVPVDVVGKPADWFLYSPENELRFRSRQAQLQGEELPPRKFLVPRQDPSYHNPYGFADLSMCFWPTTFKKGGLKFWVQFTEKYGAPWVIGKHPRSASDAETNQLLDRLEDMVQDAVAVIPDDSSVDIKEAAGKTGSTEVYERLLHFCRSEVSIALLGQNQTTEANANRASAQAGLEVTRDIRDGDKAIVQEAFNTLIRWVCELNFNDGARPVFEMWEQQEVDKVLAERDEKLVRAGAKLTPAYFKRAYSLQDGDLDEAAEPIAPAAEFAEGDVAPDQDALDAALDALSADAMNADAQAMLAPLLKRIAKGAKPDELLGTLADLYPEMDATGLQERLARMIFVANLWGRLHA